MDVFESKAHSRVQGGWVGQKCDDFSCTCFLDDPKGVCFWQIGTFTITIIDNLVTVIIIILSAPERAVEYYHTLVNANISLKVLFLQNVHNFSCN